MSNSIEEMSYKVIYDSIPFTLAPHCSIIFVSYFIFGSLILLFWLINFNSISPIQTVAVVWLVFDEHVLSAVTVNVFLYGFTGVCETKFVFHHRPSVVSLYNCVPTAFWCLLHPFVIVLVCIF